MKLSDSLTTQLMEGWKHKKRQHWEVDWATMSSSLVSMRSMVRGAGAPLELGWILLIFLEIDDMIVDCIVHVRTYMYMYGWYGSKIE